jgi:hypothetical protein
LAEKEHWAGGEAPKTKLTYSHTSGFSRAGPTLGRAIRVHNPGYNTLLLSRVYEQKVAAGDLEAIEFLKGTSPVAWRNVNLIGNFDFTTSSSPVDIDALAAHYENEDFWHRSMQEGEDDNPESSVNAN